jgi:hypothetical protein
VVAAPATRARRLRGRRAADRAVRRRRGAGGGPRHPRRRRHGGRRHRRLRPLNPDQEQRAAAILAEEWPDARVTLSHELGRIGLLARENVSLLNAALVPMAMHTVAAFREALAGVGIAAPLFITQNDGTVVSSEEAAAYPVRSFASGPTNSLRGAAFLSGLDRALVIDVGGTTSDVGSLVNGFPREANNVVEVGGVRTCSACPTCCRSGSAAARSATRPTPTASARSASASA